MLQACKLRVRNRADRPRELREPPWNARDSRRRHRRQRLLRPRHGHPAEARGPRRLRRARARRGGRRHLVGQHLPRLRAATSPPTSTRSRSRRTRLVRDLLRAAGDPRLPDRLRGRVRRPRPRPLQPRADRRPLGRRRRSAGTIDTTGGSFRARVLILAAGALFEPKIPDFPGIDSFEGEKWHSARWNHDYDLKGKNVVSIGTGASAIQLVPAIQPEVEQLTVVQRTPPWVFPHSGRDDDELRAPALQAPPVPPEARARRRLRAARDVRARLRQEPEDHEDRREDRDARTCASAIDDPELIEKVTPDYTIGCKRILPSNKWYPALAEDNVELVTSGVKEVKPNAIVFEDGSEREADAIIFSTGFQVTEMPSSQPRAQRATARRCASAGRRTAARRPTWAPRSTASRTCS